jgi:hypothetical protein
MAPPETPFRAWMRTNHRAAVSLIIAPCLIIIAIGFLIYAKSASDNQFVSRQPASHCLYQLEMFQHLDMQQFQKKFVEPRAENHVQQHGVVSSFRVCL